MLIGTVLFFILIQLSLLITALFDTVKGLGVLLQFNNHIMILNILQLKKEKKEKKNYYTGIFLRVFFFTGYTQHILIVLAMLICCVVRS